MAGRHNFNDLRNRMAPERRNRNEQKAKKTLQRMLLSDLRRAAGVTQVELAQAMGITQPTLSNLESQTNIQLGTLRRIIQALGGELEVIARLPSGRVWLDQYMSPQDTKPA